jgi:hypothetical protein
MLPDNNDEPVVRIAEHAANFGPAVPDITRSRYYKKEIDFFQLPDTGPKGFKTLATVFLEEINRLLKQTFLIGIPKGTPGDVVTALKKAIGMENIEMVAVSGEAELSSMASERKMAAILVDLSPDELNAHVPSVAGYVSAMKEEISYLKARQLMLKVTSLSLSPNELSLILKEVTRSLDEMKPFSIEELRKLKRGVAGRKKLVRSVYNDDKDMREAVAASRKTTAGADGMVMASTEGAVSYDIFAAENAAMAAKNENITQCFIYGSEAKTEEEAKGYLRACGYDEKTIAGITFVDGSERTYSGVLTAIKVKTGLPKAKYIGIRCLEKELGRKDSEEGVLLEIGAITMNGQKVYAAINSYQALLRLLTKWREAATLDSVNVPGVTDGKMRGLYKYLPPIVPVDYSKEVEVYRNAVEQIRTAA